MRAPASLLPPLRRITLVVHLLPGGPPIWPLLLAPLALAAPELTFPRQGEGLYVRRFAGLVGEGPVWGHPPRRHGPVTAWIFPDGVVEHAAIHEGGQLAEVRRYDAAGHPLTTVRYAQGRPATVTVHEPDTTEVDLADWAERALDGAVAWLPSPSSGPTQWHTDSLQLTVEVLPGRADPFAAAFREELLAACGCVLDGHSTAWIDGHPAARYRVRLAHPSAPWTGEVWVAARQDSLLVVTAMVPAESDGSPVADGQSLGIGRAVVALIRWEEPP